MHDFSPFILLRNDTPERQLTQTGTSKDDFRCANSQNGRKLVIPVRRLAERLGMGRHVETDYRLGFRPRYPSEHM